MLGPWRGTAEDAVKDAIRAKQARRDEDGVGWHWAVPGSIEEGEGRPLIAAGGSDSPSARHARHA